MTTLYKNADNLVQAYGERDATGEHKLNIERCRAYEEWFNDFQENGLALNGSSDDTGTIMIVDIDAGATVTSGSSVAAMATDSTDNDGVQLSFANSTTASKGSLVMEARLSVASAITGSSCFIGFTDTVTVEEPFSISGTTITSTASDAVGFLFDGTDATNSYWYCVGVANDVDATGNAIADTAALTANRAPVAATEQVFRVEVDSDGAGAKFFINGQKVGETTANSLTAATAVYATVVHHNRAAAVKTWNVDYMYMSNNR